MTYFTVKYVDKEGDLQDFETAAEDRIAAIGSVHELCPDCRRVISAIPSPMYEE